MSPDITCTNHDVLYFGGPVPALTIVDTCYMVTGVGFRRVIISTLGVGIGAPNTRLLNTETVNQQRKSLVPGVGNSERESIFRY